MVAAWAAGASSRQHNGRAGRPTRAGRPPQDQPQGRARLGGRDLQLHGKIDQEHQLARRPVGDGW
jgi:hypothetical protein